MKNDLSKNKLGLTLGIFSALIHAAWAILIRLGVGQPLIDWILPLHFLNSIYTVTNFSLGNAVLLIALAFIGGYICGWLFVAIWDWVKERTK